MNIAVVGTGYVGLVTGACFAEVGHRVICVDTNKDKIENLNKGILPIYEPGLDKVVLENSAAKRLIFTTSISSALEESDVVFIAVGTPPGEDGSADMKYVLAVATEIGKNINRYTVVVDKSTVPVGTAGRVREVIAAELLQRNCDVEFDVVSNPEFLKEGAAVDDFMRPDRIVIGAESEESRQKMTELYSAFNRNHQRLVFMGIRDAEMTKYAANAMLATKISFMNEIASLCDVLDVDVENVRLGIGSDQRIGFHFIYPGAGYGGSCFPKDVKALIHTSEKIGFDSCLLNAVEERNNLQKHTLFNKVVAKFGTDLTGLTFAVWGLAFKPGTDDMREAPSTSLINSLLKAGARVQAYDPVAIDNAKLEYDEAFISSNKLQFAAEPYGALVEADAMILVTEWKPFRNPDFKVVKRLLNAPLIFDGRNQYDIALMAREGFEYYGIGRKLKALS